jgi:isopentenyl-diphosphate Delta-isomerase
MTEEYLDILDEQGNKTGESRSYLEAHEKGLTHAAVHVWFVNSKKEILLQKRGKDRKFFPSHWDISAAGHVSAGQTHLEAATRETKEELGLNILESDLNLICTLRTDSVFPEMGMNNREFNPVYVVREDINISDIKLEDGEVEAVKFLSLGEFKKWVDRVGEKMTPHEEEYAKLIEYLEK